MLLAFRRGTLSVLRVWCKRRNGCRHYCEETATIMGTAAPKMPGGLGILPVTWVTIRMMCRT